MKKGIIVSLVISFIINMICFLINLFNAFMYNNIPLAYEVPGGDCVEYIGFGIVLLKIFPETSLEQAKNYIQIHFDIFNILFSLLLVFLIVLIIYIIYLIIKNKLVLNEDRDISFLTQNLIAHRGYHNIEKGIPENSIKAFKEAVKNNLLIELDVHLLKDKKVVVFHDDNIKRMTGINRKIKDMTYAEISELCLQDTNEHIPLLEDVLKLVNGKVPIIIELKYDLKCGLLEKEVIKILKNYKGKFAIKSFSPFSVNYIRKNFECAIRGQLSSDFKNKKMSKIKKFFLSNMLFNFITKPDFISYDIRTLPNKRISNLRKKKVILGWTIRNEKDLEKAKKYCDNLICENINIYNL